MASPGIRGSRIQTPADDNEEMRSLLTASGIRFRELAKLATGRRFCAGLFDWDECGVRRSWLLKIPPKDWATFGRLFMAAGGFGPMMCPHLNPRRGSRRLEEPDISRSYAVLAESLARRPDLRGFLAASWLWSPDTHRVSPHLSALSRPIVEIGGAVTVIGPAADDSGVFDCSTTRRRLCDERRFTPTMGFIIWPREAMLKWWKVMDATGLEPVTSPV